MNDTANPRLQIAEVGESVLGDNLLGLQVGNEPDLYGRYVSMVAIVFSQVISNNRHIIRHGLGGRPITYGPFDYFGQFGEVMNAINADANIPIKNNIIGPRYIFSPL